MQGPCHLHAHIHPEHEGGGEILWEGLGSKGQDGSRAGYGGQPRLQLRNRRQRLAPQLQGSLLLASSIGNL